MIRSVRESTRRCLTTFSVFTSVSPQHEADNDTQREGRGERRDGPLRDDILDMLFLFTQGLAEIVQGGLDLIRECLRVGLRGVEDSLARGVEQARHLAFERLQLVFQFASVEHRSSLVASSKGKSRRAADVALDLRQQRGTRGSSL